MAKTGKILGVVGALCAATFFGGAYYTGSQIETRYEQQIHQLNQQLERVHLQLREVHFKRHWLSSEVSYQLVNTRNNQTLLSGNDNVFHGPFPLNRLKEGKMLPSLMSIESRPQWQLPQAVFSNPQFANIRSDIDFQAQPSIFAEIEPLEIREGGSRFAVSKSTLEYTPKQAVLTIPKMELVRGGQRDLYIDSVTTVQFNGESVFANLPNLKMKSFTKESRFELEGEEPFVLSLLNTTGDGESKVEQTRWKMSGNTQAELQISIGNNQEKLGRLSYDSEVDLAAEPLNLLVGQLLLSLEKGEFQKESVLNTLRVIAAQKMFIALKNFALENDKGKLEVNFLMHLLLNDLEQIADLKGLLQAHDQTEFSLKINMEALELALTQIFRLLPNDGKDPLGQAKEVVRELTEKALSSDFVVVDKEGIKADVRISQGALQLNGTTIPEENLQIALFLLMMGLSR